MPAIGELCMAAATATKELRKGYGSMRGTTEVWESVDLSGVSTREFRISSNVERDITGAVWLPGTGSIRGLVCFGHGASGNRYQQPVSLLAERLTEAGVAILAMDGPDHGLRQVSEGGRTGMLQDLAEDHSLDRMAQEWGAAIDWVRTELAVGAAPLGYFGLSMGTAYGLGLVARRSDVRCAVLGLWGTLAGMPHNDDFVAYAHEIDCPTLFIAQGDDEFIPMDAYLDLFKVIGSSNKRMHVNPGVHAQVPLDEINYAAEYLLDMLVSSKPPHERQMVEIVDDPAQSKG